MSPQKDWVALLRSWHIWVGAIASVPIVIVAISTFFLVHKKQLSVELPSPQAMFARTQSASDEVRPADPGDLRVAHQGHEDVVWLALKKTMVRTGPQGQIIVPLEDVSDLHALDHGAVLVAAKNGLWRVDSNGNSESLHRGEFSRLSGAGSHLSALGKDVWLVSHDGGGSWQSNPLLTTPESLGKPSALLTLAVKG